MTKEKKNKTDALTAEEHIWGGGGETQKINIF